MSIIDEMLAPFEPVSLEKMDEVKLLNRMDSKFVFNAGKLPAILAQLYSSYYILEINQVRLQRYETLYFDTPEHRLYMDHHNKHLNRFKVRSRKYADSGLCYFEIKFKNNKGRTIKKRNKQAGPQEEIIGKQAQALISLTKYTPEMLLPVLRIDFSRITLVNHGMSERVTIDTGLSFSNGQKERTYPGVIIAEVKQDRSHSSAISALLHQEHVPGTKISKYCLGIISLNNHIRQNNFKEKLRYINKLNHDICETNHDVLPAFVAGPAGQGMYSATS
ncbi:MAG: polyphosphate polymerase domain-containing protein [Bacteroidetes bacterium]|nr:polyphosphate polymerase domain-containing protein [Bacteroidota bacterium]